MRLSAALWQAKASVTPRAHRLALLTGAAAPTAPRFVTAATKASGSKQMATSATGAAAAAADGAAQQQAPPKARTALDEMGAKGEFKRKESVYRDWVRKGSGRFEPEAGRYHLYVSLACPWACRFVAALHVKGLQDVIGLSVTHPTWQHTRPGQDEHTGWAFAGPRDPPLSSSTGHGSFGCEGCIPDTVNGAKFVRDLYEKVGDTFGEALWAVFSCVWRGGDAGRCGVR